MRMKDKVAVITGASSGIGRATAKAFARAGAKVCLAARREAELAQLQTEIEEEGGEATFIRTDVSLSEDVQRMVSHTTDTFGRLDYGVNNAGIEGQLGGIVDLPEGEWDRVINTNLKSSFLCVKYEAKAMLEAGHGGSIVNIGSVNSFLGFPSGSAYVASKHGQVGLTTSASAELAAQGIRVNLVCPGIVDTAMHHRVREMIGDEVFDQVLAQQVHVQRAGRPEEIAATILFVCSDEASYITGTTLTPDGGFTMTV